MEIKKDELGQMYNLFVTQNRAILEVYEKYRELLSKEEKENEEQISEKEQE